MRIEPQYIDLEINILIIKLILIIYQVQITEIIFLALSILLSLNSLYLTIKYNGNHVSESEKIALRGSIIISFVTIIYNIINIYLNNPRQIMFASAVFSFIYNFITNKGYKRYLSPFLKKTNKYTYIKNTNGDLSCSICLDSDYDLLFVKTCCGHHYHINCISKWVAQKSNCPICRSSI